MERFLVVVVCLVASCLSSRRGFGQEFSSDPSYIAFYNAKFNAEFEASAEPAIALWWIIETFGDPDVPREQLREELLRHTMEHPDTRYSGQVKSYLAIVTRMLEEKRPGNDEPIAQLIFDLRELNMRQFMQPNLGLRIVGPRIDAIEQLRETTAKNAAERLRDIGYDAVPSLIDHLDDDTLTRSVDFWRDFVFSHRVITVGECCRQILDSILTTGRVFDLSSDADTAKQAMKNHYGQLIEQKRAEAAVVPKQAVADDLDAQDYPSPSKPR